MEVLYIGQQRKRFAATEMNDHSSRSHTAFILNISQTSTKVNDALIRSKLMLLDLAGSERVKKSNAIGQRLKEAVDINYSLLVLGKVIDHLNKGSRHIPYFESKLTTLLKSAFGGNCRTLAFVNCRPEDKFGDETLQSLRFGERCNMISNKLRTAATSLETTIQTIDDAIATVRKQILSLEQKNRQHLESYQRLQHTLKQMENRRSLVLGL